ncbi:uncharacterized protein LOC120128322 isoform X1 [Hibiscus syriacus]|uniref:uncharacterized protein LOC120128322 isoform X1 n=1 Tax=Hibiscus syriacus TaxID=106335 RepID=UPI0019225A3E|nr:uncharacterized protein LOC120128322 isoform X1 [Hibiscus syriacus]
MKHVLTSINNGESSRVTTPNDPDIVFLGSSSESSRSRSSITHIMEHPDVMDLDKSEMRGINANHMDSMNDEETEAKARQLEADEMLARELQEQLYHEIDETCMGTSAGDELLPTSFRTLMTRSSRLNKAVSYSAFIAEYSEFFE